MKRKLKSKSGASFVTALLFFLLCAMITAIVVTAASVNVGRLAREREAKSAYLAVSSAAKLIRDGMAGGSYVSTTYAYPDRPEGGYPCGNDAASHPLPTDVSASEFESATFGDSFGDLIEDLIANKASLDATDEYTRNVTIQADGMPDVLAVFAVDKDGNIKITLDTDGANAAKSPMTISFDVWHTETPEPELETRSHVYDTGGVTDGQKVYGVCEYDVLVTRDIYKWNDCLISKGAN